MRFKQPRGAIFISNELRDCVDISNLVWGKLMETTPLKTAVVEVNVITELLKYGHTPHRANQFWQEMPHTFSDEQRINLTTKFV